MENKIFGFAFLTIAFCGGCQFLSRSEISVVELPAPSNSTPLIHSAADLAGITTPTWSFAVRDMDFASVPETSFLKCEANANAYLFKQNGVEGDRSELISPNHAFKLVLDASGNCSVWDNSDPKSPRISWHTKIKKEEVGPRYRLAMQPDGNVVLSKLDPLVEKFSFQTVNLPDHVYYLFIDDAGNVSIYISSDGGSKAKLVRAIDPRIENDVWEFAFRTKTGALIGSERLRGSRPAVEARARSDMPTSAKTLEIYPGTKPTPPDP